MIQYCTSALNTGFSIPKLERSIQLKTRTGADILKLGSVQKLCTCLGIVPNPLLQPDEFIESLRQADPRYQGARHLLRYELESDQENWSPELAKKIMQVARSLGMRRSETPLTGVYDLVIALAGARQSNLDRLRYAAGTDAKQASIRELIIAGSTRILPDAEKQNVANYSPRAKTEERLCWDARHVVETESGLKIGVVIKEDEKAGNAEVIEEALAEVALPEGARIAVVTTQIYQCAAALDLARIAKKFGITDTFAAGNPSDPAIVAKRTTATYLSEVLRTLRAAVLAAQDGV